MSTHPVVEVADVGNSVDDAAGAEDVGILCEKSGGDDACLVLSCLEVGVGEEEEERGEGVFGEVVGGEFHAVGAHDGDVLVGAWGGGGGGGGRGWN